MERSTRHLIVAVTLLALGVICLFILAFLLAAVEFVGSGIFLVLWLRRR
ncbi:MAG TPA: hypothetical protein VEG66_06920 [Thermoplasmata archaeon]|nr:hypothetical protein [Thermoplasmata archaeon]